MWTTDLIKLSVLLSLTYSPADSEAVLQGLVLSESCSSLKVASGLFVIKRLVPRASQWEKSTRVACLLTCYVPADVKIF